MDKNRGHHIRYVINGNTLKLYIYIIDIQYYMK